jgi:hypothetical protein
MRAIAVLTLMAAFLPISLFGQNTQKISTFTSSAGGFRFVYPADFQVCMQSKVEPCNQQSYIPVCEPDAFVCVVYPAKPFKNTIFGAASFQVSEIFAENEMMTADICVTPRPDKYGDRVSDSPGFLISAEHPVELIGGVQFVRGLRGGAALSHSITVDLYRAFHKQRCFELSTSQTGTDPNVSDPPMKTLTPAQGRKVDQGMSLMLHSFRFSN